MGLSSIETAEQTVRIAEIADHLLCLVKRLLYTHAEEFPTCCSAVGTDTQI